MHKSKVVDWKCICLLSNFYFLLICFDSTNPESKIIIKNIHSCLRVKICLMKGENVALGTVRITAFSLVASFPAFFFSSRELATPLRKQWAGTSPTPQQCSSVLLTCWGTSSEFPNLFMNSHRTRCFLACLLTFPVFCYSLEYHSQMVSEAVKKVIKQGKVTVVCGTRWVWRLHAY